MTAQNSAQYVISAKKGYKKMHALCVDCHIASKKGPQQCFDCHEKLKEE